MRLLIFAIAATQFHASCGAVPREVPLVVSDSAAAMDGRKVDEYAKAAVGNRRVMVNERAMAAWNWPERMVGLAHEIVHTSQQELAGQRSLVRYQWLVEGFAERVAYRVARCHVPLCLPRARFPGRAPFL
ncbi:MAG: hypothetical protein HY017_14565 [Betaproteobacteria bacterium]|nr:hypothetical protein [Betaproteobacteria bacterium]